MLGPMTTMFLFVVLILVGAYLLVTLLPKPPIFNTIIWVVAGLICLYLVFKGLGIAMP